MIIIIIIIKTQACPTSPTCFISYNTAISLRILRSAVPISAGGGGGPSVNQTRTMTAPSPTPGKHQYAPAELRNDFRDGKFTVRLLAGLYSICHYDQEGVRATKDETDTVKVSLTYKNDLLDLITVTATPFRCKKEN